MTAGVPVYGVDHEGEHLDNPIVGLADILPGLLLLLVHQTHEIAGNQEKSQVGILGSFWIVKIPQLTGAGDDFLP